MVGGYVGYLDPEVGVESKLRSPSYNVDMQLIFRILERLLRASSEARRSRERDCKALQAENVS
jgi:hypothetical protein